ncbi:MAG: hypothetical protein NZL89_05215 [Leptospiraceae bacterium]|nr:hypothetical protein [Leptospiraceae bacterium]
MRNDSGEEQSLDKNIVLAIYNDDGRLLWLNPSVKAEEALQDNSTGNGNPSLPPWYLEIVLGAGLMSSSSWFSSYPLGSRYDFALSQELQAALSHGVEDGSQLVFGLAYTRRTLSANGVQFDGLYGVAFWPAEFMELRLGYRAVEGFLLAEAGLLRSFPINNAPLTVESYSRRTTFNDARATIHGFWGFYLQLGAIWEFSTTLAALGFLRYDHGLGSALEANVATQTALDGSIVSTAPLRLVPWNSGIYVGLRYRI